MQDSIKLESADRCSVPRCKNAVMLGYCGALYCERHWRRMCRRMEAEEAVVEGLTREIAELSTRETNGPACGMWSR